MPALTSYDQVLAKTRLISPRYTDEELAAAEARLAAKAADRLKSGALTFDDATTPGMVRAVRPRWWGTGQDDQARDRYGADTDLRHLCQLVISQADALHQMSTILHDVDCRFLEPAGARVLACVLYLVGREDSARFWWQYAAGAEDTAATYCLFLYHLALGEVQEANWWHDQVATRRGSLLWARAARADRYAETLGWATCLQIAADHKAVPAATTAVVGYVSTAVQFVDDRDLVLDLPLPADGFAERIGEMTTGGCTALSVCIPSSPC